MRKRIVCTRIIAAYGLLVFFTACGKMPEASSTEDKAEAATITTETTKPGIVQREGTEVQRGDLYDRNQKLLYHTVESDESNTIRMPAEEYDDATANIISDASDGLDAAFNDILRVQNPTSAENIGQSIQLTLDVEWQNALYQLLTEWKINGSVTVIEKDGAIRAAVSTPSYCYQQYQADAAYRASMNDTGSMVNKVFALDTPGSVFKELSGVLCKANGITTFHDEGVLSVEGAEIHNWDWEEPIMPYPRDLDLVRAIRNSSNTMFADAYQKIGAEKVLSDLNQYFSFRSMECDFGILENAAVFDSLNSLARSGFGQGTIQVSPVYMAAVTNAICSSDGKLYKPYLLNSILDTNTKEILGEGTEPEVVSTIPTEWKMETLEGMRLVAKDLGLSKEGVTIYAKTGTAEVGDTDHLFICASIVHPDGTVGKTIVLQVCNPEELQLEWAKTLAPNMQSIINMV